MGGRKATRHHYLAGALTRAGLTITPNQAAKFSVGQRAAALRWAQKVELAAIDKTVKIGVRPFFLDQYVGGADEQAVRQVPQPG